jgi:hypothetical protein
MDIRCSVANTLLCHCEVAPKTRIICKEIGFAACGGRQEAGNPFLLGLRADITQFIRAATFMSPETTR